MKKINITGKRGYGLFSIVDDNDFENLEKYSWYLDSKGYAVRWSRGDRKNRKHIYLHRVINNTPKKLFTDHIDRNKLNNTRSNLRSVTHSQNCRNRKTENKSGYRGVDFKQNKWRAVITINNKHKHIGYFNTKEEAHRAYLKEYKKCWLSTTLS